MINYYSETNFKFDQEPMFSAWIESCIQEHNYILGEINYIFVDDDYLYKLNKQFLNHDTLTDIITFDYTIDNIVSADIYISIERIKENALNFSDSFNAELSRVVIHGVLHLMGFKDKTDNEKSIMRQQEDLCLAKKQFN